MVDDGRGLAAPGACRVLSQVFLAGLAPCGVIAALRGVRPVGFMSGFAFTVAGLLTWAAVAGCDLVTEWTDFEERRRALEFSEGSESFEAFAVECVSSSGLKVLVEELVLVVSWSPLPEPKSAWRTWTRPW